jgi:hypothetical protein
MPTEPTLVASIRQRLAPLEQARPVLRRKVLANTALLVLVLLCALPLAFAAAVGCVWLLGTYVSQSVLSVIVGFPAGITLVAYGTYRIARPLLGRAAAIQQAYGQRWVDEFANPEMRAALPGATVPAAAGIDSSAVLASQLLSFSQRASIDADLGCSGSSGDMRWSAVRLNIHTTTDDRQRDVTHTQHHFRGWFIRLDHPAAWPGTVRLVDRAVHTTHVVGYSNLTPAGQGVVSIGSGDPVFDATGMIVLDQQHPTLPSLPTGLLQAWLAVRKHLDHPIFLALNASGSYLAIATGDGPLPLDYNWIVASDAERLAADVHTLRQLPAAIGLLATALAAPVSTAPAA